MADLRENGNDSSHSTRYGEISSSHDRLLGCEENLCSTNLVLQSPYLLTASVNGQRVITARVDIVLYAKHMQYATFIFGFCPSIQGQVQVTL
jgi:hypothetical protein